MLPTASHAPRPTTNISVSVCCKTDKFSQSYGQNTIFKFLGQMIWMLVQFNGTILVPFLIYSGTFTTIALTVSPQFCKKCYELENEAVGDGISLTVTE